MTAQPSISQPVAPFPQYLSDAVTCSRLLDRLHEVTGKLDFVGLSIPSEAVQPRVVDAIGRIIFDCVAVLDSFIEPLEQMAERARAAHEGRGFSRELEAAIEAHKAAMVALDAAIAAPGDIPEPIGSAEHSALMTLAETPCRTDAELVGKLRYLVAAELHSSGRAPECMGEYASILRAVWAHFSPPCEQGG